MQKYLEKYNLDNVSQMTDSAARVVAFMSVISSEGGQVYEAKNFAAKLPDQNLYRKTIYVTSNPDTRGYLINNMASIERDTLVHNGVIHRVDSVLEPSDLTLLGFFEEHPEYSLFAEAIELTAIYEPCFRRLF